MLSAVRGAGLLARLPGTMASMADTMRQLRALSSTVGRLREETRRFLETKDRELGEVESSIQAIQTSLTAAAAAPLPAAGGTKRPLDGRPEATNKRVREEVKLGDELRKEEKSAVKEEGAAGASFMVTADGYTEVYTDGACPNNGRGGARAGVGVYWGDHHPLNYSSRVEGDMQTNNVAEIQAAVVAIRQAVTAGRDKLIIHTDSEYLINCVTKWMQGWKKRGWKTASGQVAKNKEDLEKLDKLLLANKGLAIRWNHVRGHSNIPGNEAADRLAVAGAARGQEAAKW